MGNMVHYHMHTEYSLLDSATNYQDYVDLAVKNGETALAFTEHGNIRGWAKKWAACKKAGIKYIHGCEVYLTEDHSQKIRDNYHTVLLCKNMEGAKELNKLISISTSEDHMYYKNRISFEEFFNLSDNIISTSACLASPLNKLRHDHPAYKALVDKYDYLEIQPHNTQDQIEFNRWLYRLHLETGKPLIVGTDTHSSSAYKAECRGIMMEDKGQHYEDEDLMDLSYKTYDELLKMFEVQNAIPKEAYVEALENTYKMADLVDTIELDASIKYPILYGTREADEAKYSETLNKKFEEKCRTGIISNDQIPNFKEALREETEVFKKLGMTGFMLSMSEILSWCKDRGFAIGPARGSVGGSRVAYTLDIIDLNPETWHTVFSRFCNVNRVEIGDIDVDVVDTDRPKIFEYIINRFGRRKTARVPTYGTLAGKAAIDCIGRVLIKRPLNSNDKRKTNQWTYDKVKQVKSEFEADEEGTRKKYPELFYYYDGLAGVKISQGVHPAGIVVSPITLDDNFGTFQKDGYSVLQLDMDEIHDYTGIPKYDFLILKTVTVLRDTCAYAGVDYPKTSEVDWNDQAVWEDMLNDSMGIFQMEGDFAFNSLKKFKPKSIFDISLVTAAIRPSGASYRDKLLARVVHKNPSQIIDSLLKDNLGYLIYQEDTIKFLQQICGLSGSDADNIRRAIGHKDKDRLDKAMPDILRGYCEKSSLPKEEAEEEAKEFLQIIEDSASYQFGYNHSIAYSLLSFLCAYYRLYYPVEFLTAFLNNAANSDDIANATSYAEKIKIRIESPKWGYSKSKYHFNKEARSIAKGTSSIKGVGDKVSDELFDAAQERECHTFMEVLNCISELTSADNSQIINLIYVDYFAEFGKQNELLRILDDYNALFKKSGGELKKQVKRDKVDGTELEPIFKKYCTYTNKDGSLSASYKYVDVHELMREIEQSVKDRNYPDVNLSTKAKRYYEVTGTVMVTNNEEDRRKLIVTEMKPCKRKSDGKQFGWSVFTKSIGSGVEARFTLFNGVYKKNPISKDDIILCTGFERDGQYFRLTKYMKI